MRLLLIEDNERLSEFIREGLKKSSFDSDPAYNAEEALASLQAQPYDLAILDLGLPDKDGLFLLKDIKAINKNLPVLILTARDGIDDKVTGLNSGADDYLPKPFAIEELLARIRALLRRPGQSLGTELRVGNIVFNTETLDIIIAGKHVKLTRREMSLLEQLMRCTGQVLAKERIESRLYSYGDTGSANSVEVLMHRLRKKLSDYGADTEIHTLRGIGYMLAEPSFAE